MKHDAIPPPTSPEAEGVEIRRKSSEPPAVRIQRIISDQRQNLGLGAMLTAAYLVGPLVGMVDFNTKLYVATMLGVFGVVNLPALFGKRRGSIGPLTAVAYAAGKLGAVGNALLVLAVTIVMLLAGCGVSLHDTTREGLNVSRETIFAVCYRPTESCEAAVTAYNTAVRLYRIAKLAEDAGEADAGEKLAAAFAAAEQAAAIAAELLDGEL